MVKKKGNRTNYLVVCTAYYHPMLGKYLEVCQAAAEWILQQETIGEKMTGLVGSERKNICH